MNRVFKSASIVTATLLLAACGGGGGGSSSGQSSSSQTPAASVGDGNGQLSLALVDAPVDDADNVLVEFTGVEIKPVEGSWEVFDLEGDSLTCINWLNGNDPVETPEGQPTIRCIDLLALQGGASELILDGVTVPAGDYNGIRLSVNAERDTLDSVLVDETGGWNSLWIPSGSQSGLKLNSTFTVGDEGRSDFIIDFDLRKSVNNPQGFPDYRLKPSLKLIENSRSGALFGVVDTALIQADNCSNGEDNTEGNSVYIFQGDVDPVDYRGEDTDPYTTAMVELNDNGDYVYRAAFLPVGTYTAAFTCQGASDDPEAADDLDFNPESPARSVRSIEAGQDTELNFTAAA